MGHSKFLTLHTLAIFAFLLILSFAAFSQGKDSYLQTSLMFEVQKKFLRNAEFSIEEDLRLWNGDNVLNRSMTTVGVNYALWERKVRVGAYYCFIHLYNDDHFYENRHRYYTSLSYKETIGRFSLSWRTRMQGTARNERHGEYKINPKYVWRNKLEVEYSFFGAPWKPYLSCEIANVVNNPINHGIYKVKFQGGTTWRLNRTTALEFFLREDEYMDAREARIFTAGVGYKMMF
jgi:hypothetical protein